MVGPPSRQTQGERGRSLQSGLNQGSLLWPWLPQRWPLPSTASLVTRLNTRSRTKPLCGTTGPLVCLPMEWPSDCAAIRAAAVWTVCPPIPSMSCKCSRRHPHVCQIALCSHLDSWGVPDRTHHAGRTRPSSLMPPPISMAPQSPSQWYPFPWSPQPVERLLPSPWLSSTLGQDCGFFYFKQVSVHNSL